MELSCCLRGEEEETGEEEERERGSSRREGHSVNVLSLSLSLILWQCVHDDRSVENLSRRAKFTSAWVEWNGMVRRDSKKDGLKHAGTAHRTPRWLQLKYHHRRVPSF